ncbi:MAG: hypothetical protein ABSD74_01770 [Rhizomicrobium sp.]|jgi:hypothetical protein
MTSQDEADQSFALAINFSVEMHKAFLILNGGAATALVALMSKDARAPNFTLAVLSFGGGAVATVGAMAIAYCANLSYANHRQDIANGDKKAAQSHHREHVIFQVIWGGIAVIAFALAASGLYEAWLAAPSPR